MISTGELKKGVTIELEGQHYQVLDYQHIKMGRGSAQVRIKLRDIKGGHTIERSFQAGEKFPLVHMEYHAVQYLYNDDNLYYFMDVANFEQIVLNKSQLGDALNYLKENANLTLVCYNEEPVGIDLPPAMELKVIETGPGFKGDMASAGSKPAKLETGITIQVPYFVNTGDVIKVNTRTAEYLERAS